MFWIILIIVLFFAYQEHQKVSSQAASFFGNGSWKFFV